MPNPAPSRQPSPSCRGSQALCDGESEPRMKQVGALAQSGEFPHWSCASLTVALMSAQNRCEDPILLVLLLLENTVETFAGGLVS